MTNDNSNRPTGLYVKYLQRLHEQREQAGLLPAPDICDSEYWDQRRRDELLKQQSREGAKERT
jgi:hypothetical protein